MNFPLVALSAVLAAAAPPAPTPGPAAEPKVVEAKADPEEFVPDPKAVARFKFLQLRGYEREGIPADAAKIADPLKWGPKPAPWAKLPGDRAAVFDARFGSGTYLSLTRICDYCQCAPGSEDGWAADDLFMGAYGFIDLDKQIASGAPAKGSEAQLKREAELSAAMREAVESFRPKDKASARYRTEYKRFSEQILRGLSRK